MADLARLFVDMLGKKANYLAGNSGDDFEQRIMKGLHNAGFNRILPEDIEKPAFDNLKKSFSGHFHDKHPHNPLNFREHYFHQPLGKQNYPDFVVLWDDRLVCLEAKFSTKSQRKPVWNSGLPRQSGVYIFGSRERGDITFFVGRDVVDEETARSMHKFFDDLRTEQRRFNANQIAQRYGFAVYVRKAFEQTKRENPDAILDFFTNPHRVELERSVIDFVKS